MNSIRPTFYLFIFCWIYLSIPFSSYAQNNSALLEYSTDVEVSFAGSTGENLPFWLHSNRWGIIDRNGANGFLRLTPKVGLPQIGPIKVQAGAELIGRLSHENSIFFNEVYLQADWKIFRLVAGRKKERIGITDSSLTAGSMIQSGNASPIPKLRIFTPEFVEIPGTNQWLSFKGYFSHGWLENSRVTSGAYLHQKYLYLRFFRERSRFNAYGGFVHNVTWAGTHPGFGDLPDGFKNFIRVVLAKNIAEDDPNFPGNETGGTLGNTTAGYDTALEMDFDFGKVLVHRLFYLEDRPGLWFRSPLDGLWGVSLKLKHGSDIIQKISWEHLNTTKQGSKSFERRGADNYYNNGIYYSGWTYHDRTIGSPFLFTRPGTVGVQNNIVVMHYLGLQGKLSEDVQYKLMGSYSRNYGANSVITDAASLQRVSGRMERADQYSLMLQTVVNLSTDLSLNIDLAYDTGELYPDQIGTLVSLSYRFR